MQQVAPFFLQNLNSAANKNPSGAKNLESHILEPSAVFSMPLTPWAEQLLNAKTDDECTKLS